MRTTLKRRIGRWEQTAGNGRSAPPPPRRRISHYEQPVASGRVLRGVGRFLLNTLLFLAITAGGAAGGAYLWAHQKVAQTAAHSKDVKAAKPFLKAPLPNQPVIALVIGYDHRAGMGADKGRSDTLMLVRADPRKGSQSISLLSFPRDLREPLYCGGPESNYNPQVSYADAKINSAYGTCGAIGSLLTVKALTGLPINYIVPIAFRGFTQIVSHVGGVYVDVDRRYYIPPNTGTATINLEPGYQRLRGAPALDYVRFRHFDDDYHRIMRQQAFMRAFRQRLSKMSLWGYVNIVNTIAKNVEVEDSSGKSIPLKTLLSYARLAQSVPGGNLIQVKIENVRNINDGTSDTTVSEADLQNAIDEFANPDLTAAARAANQNHVARAKTPAAAAPAPEKTTVLVLNASGTEGLARDTGISLTQRRYNVVQPAGGAKANYPGPHLWDSVVYFDPAQSGAKAAATEIASFFDATSVHEIGPKIAPLANGAMVVVALGQAFDGTLPPIVPKVEVPAAEPPKVKVDPGITVPQLRALQRKFPFRLQAPSRVESSSYMTSDSPRVYWMTPKERTLRLVFKISGSAAGYWGIQETKWADAPVLASTHVTKRINGRTYGFYYQGVHLHMVVLYAGGASYWVINTLDDSLSNETMIAIAKGLRPVSGRLHK
ncbi:MAG: LCP family protein [Gaiellaceae bacterium]